MRKHTIAPIFSVILTSLFFAINTQQVFSQNPLEGKEKIDSLTDALQKSAEDIKRVNILNELSSILSDADYELRLKYADSALKLSTRLEYKKGKREAYTSLGNIRTNYTLDFRGALNDITSALRLTDTSEWQVMQNLYSRLAFINKRQNNLTKSIEFYNLAIGMAERHQDVLNLTKYHSYLAEVYESQNNMPLALEHLGKIMELEKGKDLKSTEPTSLVSIAHFYGIQNQNAKAEKYYLDAYSGFERTNNLRWSSYVLFLLAELNLKQGKDDIALDYATKGLDLAVRYKLLKETSDNHYILSAIYDSLGNDKKAYYHYRAMKQIEDSVFSLRKTEEVARIQARYDADMREGKLVVMKAEKELIEGNLERVRILLLALGIGLILLIIIIWFVLRDYLTKKLVNKELVNRVELREMKLNEIIKYLNEEAELHVRTKSQLEITNSELNQFMYKSSHDLKAPLNSIVGLTNLALGDITEKERKEYVGMISKATGKLKNILQDLLDATKVRDGDTEYVMVNVSEFVSDIVNQLKYAENVKVEMEIDKKLEIRTDKNLFRTILQNVIENGIKYRNTTLKNSFVKITAMEEDKILLISVADNGMGIPEQSQDKIFDAFVRANTTSDGTGLGLYLVKKAVERLGGKINLSSKEGQGTKIEILIPKR